MKLVLTDDFVPGVLSGDDVIDIAEAVGSQIMALPGEFRMAAIIKQWEHVRPALEASIKSGKSRSGYRLRAPLPRPGKLLFAAANYNEGIENPIDVPIDMFMKSPTTLIGPDDEVHLPSDDAQLFFHEAELGFVIGKGGRDIPASAAMDHIFGYTCVNDVSSFGLPGATGGMRNKNFDTFGPIGPCIVTKDEIADPHALEVRLWVDDTLRQHYETSDMEHRIPKLIAWASHIVTLEAGDLMACGTNHTGIGPIQDGETMRLEIQGIGAIKNTVRDALGRKWPVGPDLTFSEWVHRFKSTGDTSGALFSVRRLDAVN